MAQNEEILITTLPIKPREKTTIGMSLAPFLASLLGTCLDGKSILSTNLLHSYDDRQSFLPEYKKALQKLDINFNDIFIDTDHCETFLNCIDELIQKKKIITKKETVLLCECQKVDILKEGVRNYEEGDLYYSKDNKIYCKCCNKECKTYESERLYLKFNKEDFHPTSLFPFFYKKSMEMFQKQYQDQFYMISKERNTGYSITHKRQKFNLDIDFLWMQYPNCFPEEKQILIASNHQLFEMFLLNYINSLISKKEIHFIATPYLKNPNAIDLENFFQLEDTSFQKMCLLYTLKWRNNNANWDMSIMKGLQKLNKEQRKKLEQYLYSFKKFEKENVAESIHKYFVHHVNFQENMRLIRKGRI